MRKVIFLSLLLVGCSDPTMNTTSVDQCLRVELFKSCMASLPEGPKSTQYNDWDEVVSECGSQAYYQSIRPIKSIKPGCYAGI